MTVRAAKFVDIPPLVDIMADAHARSRDAARTTFDALAAKQLLARCIQRHGQTNYMASMVLVSEHEGAPQGFVIGILDLVYPCLQELKVTDLLFIMAKSVNSLSGMKDAREMLRQLVQWGRNNPKVIKAVFGATDDLVPWEPVARLYATEGLETCGSLLRIDFDRNAIAEAS